MERWGGERVERKGWVIVHDAEDSREFFGDVSQRR